ncbi:membrane protein [Dietzia sp. UCD-THP]|uniref:RDD family protein n=1 Tax=Dietzia sp. UCD-THP TaxID=1292020 RepID=UPI00037F1B04|nr:RDD family protein [Dietzia sp. UCD-THP]EYT64416.1 membrane protein [Dietzia sp. UCD-THP]
MREIAGSWLSGPTSSGNEPEQAYKGERLGLPEHGEGSLAPLGVRLGALLVDWFLAYGFVGLVVSLGGAGLLGGETFSAVASWATPLLWGVSGVVCVWLFAQTPGQALFGIGTARIDAEDRVGLIRAIVRVFFVFFLIPPLVQDEDGRGLHDRATGTALIRTR